MPAQTIMVQIADPHWTTEALHAACLLARKTGAKVALLCMIPVQHTGWLGTELGNRLVTPHEKKQLEGYQQTIEDYGVASTLTLFQYSTWVEGTLQAVEIVNPDVVFVQPPAIRLSYWRRWQINTMKRHFARVGRVWIDSPVYVTDSEPVQPHTGGSARMYGLCEGMLSSS